MMKFRKTKLFMDTVIDIQVVADHANAAIAKEKIDLAFESFRNVEQACSRFTPESELMQAIRIIQEPVQVSPFLFEPLKFALQVAEWTDGLFDPTVGKALEDLGFNRHYLTGERLTSLADNQATYQDLILDESARTMLLRKPMVVDLGAVAKGFAIDLAANELKEFDGFLVNAGGDLFAGGLDENGDKWKVGIQHPYQKDKVIYSLELSNEAICTSGSYERKSAKAPGQHHIVHPNSKHSPNDWVSCSVIAPFAMMADAFSTTAFLLGSTRGEDIIQNLELKGLFIAPELQIVRVGGI